jgi:hypothetical protein
LPINVVRQPAIRVERTGETIHSDLAALELQLRDAVRDGLAQVLVRCARTPGMYHGSGTIVATPILSGLHHRYARI